ncbi:hypothetical protein VTJ04DRAFT_7465 [Mycothermus thermophilus]|uniref:uncharacterized protein n=1 Tax=Humicola insolens TaxID=85995 RepID=UPI00374407EA
MSDAAWTTGEQSGDAYPWANNEDFAPRQAPHATVADYPHHESQMPSQYPDQPVSAQSYDAATTSANANERLGTPEVGISRQSTGNVSNATSTEVHMPKPVDHDSPDGDAMDDGQTTEQSTVRPSTTSGPADLNSAIDNPWRGPVDDTRHYLPQEQEVSHMGGDDRTARQDCRATYGHGETDFEEPASTGYTGTASSWGIHHQDRAQATHDNQTSEQQVVYCERYDSTPYGTSADASSSVPGGVMYRSGFPVQVPSNYPYATELPELDSSEASESATEQHERGHRARHDHDQYYADASGSATGREEGRERHHRGDRDRDAAGRHRRRERDRDVAEASESATRMDERQRHRRHDRDRDHAEASGSSSGRHHHKDRDRRGDKKAGKKGRY